MARAQAATTTPAANVGKTGAAQAAKAKAKKGAAKAAPKPEGPPSYIDRTFRSASQAERCLRQWVDRWGSYASLDPTAAPVAKAIQDALANVVTLKGSLETLHRGKWEPPKLAGGQALPLQVDTQVWINTEHRGDYTQVFDQKDLDSKLFVDSIVNGKMVVRIGDKAKPQARFFVPKSHVTTTKP